MRVRGKETVRVIHTHVRDTFDTCEGADFTFLSLRIQSVTEGDQINQGTEGGGSQFLTILQEFKRKRD
jgi:hypothetical protein